MINKDRFFITYLVIKTCATNKFTTTFYAQNTLRDDDDDDIQIYIYIYIYI